MRRIFDKLRTTSSPAFWTKTSTGGLAACVFGLTLAWPQWIEAVFGADPDGGSGQAEWGVTAALAMFVVVMFVAARREWNRDRDQRPRHDGVRKFARRNGIGAALSQFIGVSQAAGANWNKWTLLFG
jgi:hypothetical protein